MPDSNHVVTPGLALIAFIALGGCGGGEKRGSDTAGAAGTTGSAQAPTTSAPTSGASGNSTSSSPTSITPQLVALGDSIFHGFAGGGTCQTCHGQDAKGTTLAPNLTDNQWINGDGSYQFIVNTVSNGVLQPKQHPAPMPPMGGASLTPEQIRAVAAYVYSLSHPGAP